MCIYIYISASYILSKFANAGEGALAMVDPSPHRSRTLRRTSSYMATELGVEELLVVF